ncbi:MAG: M28 family peptidase, partial [Bacteroidota bacterium]
MTSRLLPLFFLFFAQFVHAQSRPERLRTHLDFLAADSLDGRGLGTAGKQKAALYIAESFRNAGLAPFDDDYFQEFFIRISMANMTGTNVIGVLEGSDPELKKEYIVLGAHYDHVGYEMKNGQRVVYNGADDNASGTAGLMELVRILSGRRAELKRSIIFIAFDGEESGLLGSKAFA